MKLLAQLCLHGNQSSLEPGDLCPVCECFSPVVLTVSVREGDDVRGSAAAIADDHGDRRLLPETLQHDGDDVGTALQDQTHCGDTLT